MKKVLTILFLISATNVQAANNTYDNSTRILTIPSVTLGTTTYTNVVLRLNNFDILAVDPNPLPGGVIDGVLFQFNSCTLAGNTLTCKITITSQFKDTTINFEASNSSNGLNSTFIVDDKGNEYYPSIYQIGNVSKSGNQSLYNYPLVANNPTPVAFQFSNIATNASSVALFQTGPNGQGQVRNIPFR
ncbi:MAG: hypothetical protein ACOYMG_24470 [Candidatus Methylumidiphilus sp.]